MRDARPALAVVALLAAAGCLGSPAASVEATTPDTTRTTDATTATSTQTTVDTTSRESPPKGTQFVSVVRLENQSSHTDWPDARSVTFANLSEKRQNVFLRALNGSVEYGPAESNPFSYHDDSRPRVVRYQGTWYYVRVSIV